ncbi:hypothetical protein FRAHR75_860011 [Frankia sp. Hr75.2]|nr:hypothetical protein FRAHR75_860011 [Frankia sp. Hr75.2]
MSTTNKARVLGHGQNVGIGGTICQLVRYT